MFLLLSLYVFVFLLFVYGACGRHTNSHVIVKNSSLCCWFFVVLFGLYMYTLT